jgi:pectin methylesterase-like acyl-CoA thioesterase
MSLHKNLTGTELHGIQAYTYADATARLAATGFVSADVGKVALQSDNGSFWILTATTPIWSELTGSSASSISNYITVGTDGPVNFNTIKEAVQQAIADGASVTNPITVAVYPGTYTEEYQYQVFLANENLL